MEFLKKHYEKILLGLVLAGLVGALVFMPFYISSDNQKMAELTEITKAPGKELPPLDLSGPAAVTARLRAPYALDLESSNRLFNPLEWQKLADGTMVPLIGHVGPQMIIVTNITPLYLVITLETVTTNEIGARYGIGIEKQGDKRLANRRHQTKSVAKGDKANDTFALVDVKGAPENPDALMLKLVDSGEIISLSHDKVYRRVDAYAADFRYDPEKKVFHGRRVGDKVSFNGTDFIVADVKEDELIIEDQSNQKKTTRPFAP